MDKYDEAIEYLQTGAVIFASVRRLISRSAPMTLPDGRIRNGG